MKTKTKNKKIWRIFCFYFTLYLKVLFMENKPEDALTDIRNMMDRASRFHSLSGFSLVAAGICGLLGIWWVNILLSVTISEGSGAAALRDGIVTAAICTLAAALLCAILFTWLRSRKLGLPLWDAVFRRVSVNFAIPMVTGGILVIAMLFEEEYRFIACSCLFFYGLALMGAGNYTLKEVRQLGLFEILLGVFCLVSGYPLLGLALGFGVMNIVYGLYIWRRHRSDPL
jgi:hypothetical protein